MFYLMTHSTHFIYGYMIDEGGIPNIGSFSKNQRCESERDVAQR